MKHTAISAQSNEDSLLRISFKKVFRQVVRIKPPGNFLQFVFIELNDISYPNAGLNGGLICIRRPQVQVKHFQATWFYLFQDLMKGFF